MSRILIVDNAPDVRSTLVGLLADAGYEVQPAADESGALAAIIAKPVDFALIDVRLHEEGEDDESGLLLAMALRALKPQVRIILFTRYVRTSQIVRAIRYLGVVDFIEKTPDMGEKILQTLEKACGKGGAVEIQPDGRGADEYSRYESGLRELLDRVRQDPGRYSDVLVYQHRLLENTTRARRHGDTEALKAERSEIVERLNGLALSTLGIPFNELCGPPPPDMAQAMTQSPRSREGDGGKTWLSLSLAAGQPLMARARGHHVVSACPTKPLQVDIARYARRAEVARRNPTDWRFLVEEIGLSLWHDLFVEHPEVAYTYLEARADSRPLSLSFEAPREFLQLPLECLRSATPAEYMVLQHPVVRFLYNTAPKRKAFPQSLAETKKLRVLIIGSNTMPPIPGVDTEIRRLSTYLRQQPFLPIEVRVIPTDDASYEQVRKELTKGKYDILHYAGHGSYNPASPEESSLYFWSEENKQGTVVPMKAAELKVLLEDTEVCFIYLSCCYSTAAGGQTALLDDDFLGLADAVAQAGVPSVLGFRWPVSDQGANKLAQAFYHSLLEQGSPEIALWCARRELAAWDRNDPAWLSPILIHQE